MNLNAMFKFFADIFTLKLKPQKMTSDHSWTELDIMTVPVISFYSRD